MGRLGLRWRDGSPGWLAAARHLKCFPRKNRRQGRQFSASDRKVVRPTDGKAASLWALRDRPVVTGGGWCARRELANPHRVGRLVPFHPLIEHVAPLRGAECFHEASWKDAGCTMKDLNLLTQIMSLLLYQMS